jgi:tripartite-type tricarboxylate transporter receptor subunit TctC
VAWAAAARAETYPSHPITMMVGFPPGGPTDTLARILAEGMKSTLGQTVIIEDVTGASGTIATGRVVHALPDGYTIGIGNWSSHVGSPALYGLDYDIIKDLQPISLLTSSPLWILSKNALPPKTPAELFAWLKARKESTTFGTVGTGSPAQLVGIQLAQAIGARFQYVPYRGAAPAMTDLIGGHIDMACLEASGTYPDVEAGRIRAYAVTTKQRWPKSPDTPTLIESGVENVSIAFWHGLWTTKGVPQDVVDRLDAAVKNALADPTTRKRIEGLGQVIFPADQQNPAALLAYHKGELDKWWPVIKAAGIKAGN